VGCAQLWWQEAVGWFFFFLVCVVCVWVCLREREIERERERERESAACIEEVCLSVCLSVFVLI